MIFPFLLSFSVVFAPSHPEYFGIDDPAFYILEIDEHVYDIQYYVDADVIAMAIDEELDSLLVGIENTKDSIFLIDLEHEMINAQNNEFAVLVNGLEVDYEIISDDDSSTLKFFVPAGTQEIEIIGTHVIPEFPIGMALILVATMSSVLILSKTGKLGKNFV